MCWIYHDIFIPKKDEEGNLIYPKHTTRQCRLLIQQFREKQPSEKEKESDKDEDKEEDDDGFPNVNSTWVISADVESKSRLKVINKELNMVAPETQTYLKWSKIPSHSTSLTTPRVLPPPGGKRWWSTQSLGAPD